MQILKVIFLIFILLFDGVSCAQDVAPNPEIPNPLNPCFIPSDQYTLSSSWFLWDPYQFIRLSPEAGGQKVTGMDIQIINAVASKIGIKIQHNRVNLPDALSQIQTGTLDMSAGITYSIQRAAYAYYSEPYRFEENSVFVLKKSSWSLNFQNISEFLAQVRLQNFRLGVGRGFVYADDRINDFIDDETNSDIIFKYDAEPVAIDALLNDQIDGFIGDRISTSSAILHKRAVNIIDEFPLNILSSIHMIFSKKSAPLILVNSFNQEIKKFVNSQEYKDIVKIYLYPILVIHTCHSEWFYVIGLIGTIAFAISGLAIGFKENSTFFATLLFAGIPSVGTGILRDIIITPANSHIIFTPTYLYYTLIIVLLGFAAIRLLNYYNTNSGEDHMLQNFWNNVLVCADALGAACFISTGIAIAIMNRMEPIELWGPFFAFLTSHLGMIVRNLIRKDMTISNIFNEINFEITILWALIFSVFLSMNAASVHPEKIKIAVIIITLSAFITRLIAHYLKLPNIKFRNTESS
jgi:polar amino acid transport system substrate-binding protein